MRELSGFRPEAGRAPSPALRADLDALERDHAINSELIKSLLASKAEARAHIAFFKRMMFVSNGLIMSVGLAIAGFGVKRLLDGFSGLALAALIVGGLLFLRFAAVFVSMTLSLKATEALARKHDLI